MWHKQVCMVLQLVLVHSEDKKDQDADFSKNVLICVSFTIRPVNKIPVTL